MPVSQEEHTVFQEKQAATSPIDMPYVDKTNLT